MQLKINLLWSLNILLFVVHDRSKDRCDVERLLDAYVRTPDKTV